MTRTKVASVKLRDRVGNFSARDKSGTIALRQSKDGEKKYGSFRGYIKGKFIKVFLPLEVKTSKAGKDYLVGSNKGFSMSFYDDKDGNENATLYTSLQPARKPSAKRAYVQTNRKYSTARKRYGYNPDYATRRDF